MKKIVSIVVLLAIIAGGAFFFFNQKKGPEQQLVGTWYLSNDIKEAELTIVFNKDKTLKITNGKEQSRTGTWKLTSDKVKLQIDNAPDATGKLPKGEFRSIYLESDGIYEDSFYFFGGMFEKQ